LNNRVGAATALLAAGAAVGAVDGQGQTALHWAAVRGAVPAAELLLRSGASLDRPDSRGYTPTHVAAQYGNTAVLYHFAVRWGADMECLDSDGRSPLHWAAYKGFPDALRLLLVLECDALRADREGCTPLHWAAIKGNAEALYLLAQSGGTAALTAVDATGATAAQLATEKGHALLAAYRQQAEATAQRRKGLLANRGLALATAAGITALLVLFTNACVLCTVLPPPGAGVRMALYAVLATACAGLVAMYRCSTRDPGVLLAGLEGRSGGSPAQRLDLPALWAGNWGALCVTCKLVRPLGAKHCAVMNRCVARFDHFCPWVGATVGKRNHRAFLTFLLLESAALVISLATAVARIAAAPMPLMDLLTQAPTLTVFTAVDAAVALPVLLLTVAQMTQVARNITTNELANMHRYPYLRTRDGKFINPFDRGCSRNMHAFWLQPPELRDREIEFGEGASVPLLEAELSALLSGGRASTAVAMAVEDCNGCKGSEGHRH
jgi:palmitoyltransferase ZDHHC13/17